MNNFSVRDTLLKLKERNYDSNINNTIDIITEKFDEEELRTLLIRGVKLDNKLIRLHFLDNVGFRCFNEKNQIVGKMPICRNIENFMNNYYKDYVDELL